MTTRCEECKHEEWLNNPCLCEKCKENPDLKSYFKQVEPKYQTADEWVDNQVLIRNIRTTFDTTGVQVPLPVFDHWVHAAFRAGGNQEVLRHAEIVRLARTCIDDNFFLEEEFVAEFVADFRKALKKLPEGI